MAYDQLLVVEHVGLWLERILHVKNNTKGDSPKVCGMMDLLRVQGRWAAASRLAWVRCVLVDPKDVTGGEALSKSAPNNFPAPAYWSQWEAFFEEAWVQHINNIVKAKAADQFGYYIDKAGVSGFVKHCSEMLLDANRAADLKVAAWKQVDITSFVATAARGFLHSDLYTSLTELLSRAEGSFGLQVHSTLEEGVVVIASKGQPMSVAFQEDTPLVLFGSEAEAVAVAVTVTDDFLKNRIDLDSKGEIMRIGLPKALDSGLFANQGSNKSSAPAQTTSNRSLRLKSGIELRGYSLTSCSEILPSEIWTRCVKIQSKAVPYDPNIDLVKSDIRDTPRILRDIDNSWTNVHSENYISGHSFCEHVLKCISHRIANRLDIYDILISGIEVSLWIAEQWAADLRRIFPQISIATVSPNKLLGLGQHSAGKVFFPGSETIFERRVHPELSCVLLISQSGQTFATLHAARTLAPLVKGRLWIVSGARESKMEQTLTEYYKDQQMTYLHDRVILNLSGSRPAEPSSIAAAATWHTLTHLLFLLCMLSSKTFPNNRGDALEPPPLDSFVMNLTDGCLVSMNYMINQMQSNMEDIVGCSADGVKNKTITYRSLRTRGYEWGKHVKEYWLMLVCAAIYLIVTSTFRFSIFKDISTVFVKIVHFSGYIDNREYQVSFSFNEPDIFNNQPFLWSFFGVLVQLFDAIFFVFLIKILTWANRYYNGRPLWARHGKRTIVIVDSPCIHQMLEAFVSKLYAQSYSFCSVEVHGASGLDHFVHRFTHRVCRGTLIALGRPDGRIHCLAKSESAALLATKQAAFIRNHDYDGDFNSLGFEGAGPEIVSVSHNPFKPNLGTAHFITLKQQRRKFVDEVLFENFYNDSKPVVNNALRQLVELNLRCPEGAPYGSHHLKSEDFKPAGREKINIQSLTSGHEKFSLLEMKPIISTRVSILSSGEMLKENDMFRVSILSPNEMPKENDTILNLSKREEIPNDPAMCESFFSKLDSAVSKVLDKQMLVQQFYECRLASLERFMAFCVLFHAMASSSNHPILNRPWDIARSQSNLRVATTASPIAALGNEGVNVSKKTKELVRLFGRKLSKIRLNF